MQSIFPSTDRKNSRRSTSRSQVKDVDDLARRLAQGEKFSSSMGKSKGRSRRQEIKSSIRGRVKGKEVAIFTRQLSATLSAGLLLSDALQTVAEDLDNAYFEKTILTIRENIMSGMTLSMALSQYSNIFSNYYLSVVKTGEATGQLNITLFNLAKFLEKYERMKEKVRGATMYPVFIFSFACLVVLGMVVFIIPKFKEIFEQTGAELPWLTRFIVGTSDFIINHFLFLVLGFFFVILAFTLLYKLSSFRYLMDILKLKIPLIGKEIIYKSIVARFCRTLGFLLASGVPLTTSLEITSQIVNHQLIEKSILRVRNRILSGSSMSEAIKEQNTFPTLVTKMSHVGEKTGRAAEMLQKTAEYYDDELETTIQSLMVMIEPALIIVVGIIVAVIVVAIYLPIFQVALLVQ